MEGTGAALCLLDGQQRRPAAGAGWAGCGRRQGTHGAGLQEDGVQRRPDLAPAAAYRLALPQIDKSKLQAFALAKKTPFQKHKEEMEERKRVRRDRRPFGSYFDTDVHPATYGTAPPMDGLDRQREAEEAARVYAEFASSFDDDGGGGFKAFVRGEKINAPPGTPGRPTAASAWLASTPNRACAERSAPALVH